MMAKRADYIPTPWPRRLQLVQRTTLPVVCFFGCVLLTAWLWQRQGQSPNAVGEVEAVRIDIAAGTDGVLASLPSGKWSLFDWVEADTVLARLDDRPVRAEMATLTAELAQLRSELVAAAERIELEQSGRDHDHQRDWRRLSLQIQQHRLDILDRHARIETARVEETRLDGELAYFVSLRGKGTVTEMQVADQNLRRDKLRRQIQLEGQALAEAEKQLDCAAALLRDYPDLRTSNASKLTAPFEAEITVRERQLDELLVRIDSLEVCAPIAGTLCAIHCWPGQNVRAGDPIITVAADHGRHIVSYVRQEQRLKPEVGMHVMVRVRGSTERVAQTVIERIGPQYEPVPLRQQRDPNVPEWGLPVCIQPPDQLKLRPGELIDITFQKRGKGEADHHEDRRDVTRPESIARSGDRVS